MLSISEQLQKYRSLRNDAPQKDVPNTGCVTTWQHPNTEAYFRDLMKQWRKNHSLNLSTASQK